MYLTKVTHLSYDNNYDKINLKIEKNTKEIDLNRVSIIREDLLCWRKANQIHKWFVENVQDGNDDCKEYYVSVNQLKDLLKTCEIVIRKKQLASKLLPTLSGFYFGGTDYDKYYFEEVESTIENLKKILNEDYTGSSII